MAFKVQVSESVEAGVKRIVEEQLKSALKDLRDTDPKKADAAVHATRKRFKRLRALLRLVRKEIGEEIFARENSCYRDAGGSLSEARDAHVLVLTLDSLKEDVDAAAYEAGRKKLLARRRTVKKRVLELGNSLEAVAAVVEQARLRAREWKIEQDGFKALKSGLSTTYQAGRECFELASVGAHGELFHDWRKRVKNLWHQLEVIEGVWPAIVGAMAEECHRLADLLGQEHDLAVLQAVLEAEALVNAEEPTSLVATIKEKRLELQTAARAVGDRIFAEKTSAFIKRLGKYWRAWTGRNVEEEAVVLDEAEHVQEQPVVEEGGGPISDETGPAPADAVTVEPVPQL